MARRVQRFENEGLSIIAPARNPHHIEASRPGSGKPIAFQVAPLRPHPHEQIAVPALLHIEHPEGRIAGPVLEDRHPPRRRPRSIGLFGAEPERVSSSIQSADDRHARFEMQVHMQNVTHVGPGGFSGRDAAPRARHLRSVWAPSKFGNPRRPLLPHGRLTVHGEHDHLPPVRAQHDFIVGGGGALQQPRCLLWQLGHQRSEPEQKAHPHGDSPPHSTAPRWPHPPSPLRLASFHWASASQAASYQSRPNRRTSASLQNLRMLRSRPAPQLTAASQMGHWW